MLHLTIGVALATMLSAGQEPGPGGAAGACARTAAVTLPDITITATELVAGPT